MNSPVAIAVSVVALLHLAFMVFEFYPWRVPKIMRAVVKKWKHPLSLGANEEHLVSMVVHNAGVYNGIVGSALVAAVATGSTTSPVTIVLLAGAMVAGEFGARTLSPATRIQAILSAGAICIVLYSRSTGG